MALAILILLLAPSDFEIISWYPAISSTDLTALPATKPVPALAGFKITLVAPSENLTSCGIVLPSLIGTLTTFLFASCLAFLTASETSLAFPIPKPTRPFLSPTKTTA